MYKLCCYCCAVVLLQTTIKSKRVVSYWDCECVPNVMQHCSHQPYLLRPLTCNYLLKYIRTVTRQMKQMKQHYEIISLTLFKCPDALFISNIFKLNTFSLKAKIYHLVMYCPENKSFIIVSRPVMHYIIFQTCHLQSVTPLLECSFLS